MLVLALALAGWQSQAHAQNAAPDTAGKIHETPASRIVWHHVGRVFINPSNGQFVYVGYLVHIGGIDSSLFNGSPGESTAYFTFSTDVAQLTPLPNNGDVALDLVSAGTFNVYYNAKPNGDWSNPASFSSGKLIATFQRKESLFRRSDLFHFTVCPRHYYRATALNSMARPGISATSLRTASPSPNSSAQRLNLEPQSTLWRSQAQAR